MKDIAQSSPQQRWDLFVATAEKMAITPAADDVCELIAVLKPFSKQEAKHD